MGNTITSLAINEFTEAQIRDHGNAGEKSMWLLEAKSFLGAAPEQLKKGPHKIWIR